MKKCHIIDYNGVWENIGIESVPLAEADIILHFQDIEPSLRGDIAKWKDEGRKIVVMQHGRHAMSDYQPPRSCTPVADTLLVWSEWDIELLKRQGITNYVHTGSLIFTHLKPKIQHEGTNIVYVPSDFGREVREHFDVAAKLRELPYRVTTKLIVGHEVDRYDNPSVTDRGIAGHLDKCIEILQTADVVVSVFDATFELLAMAMGVPVIVVDHWSGHENLGVKVIPEYSKGVTVSKLEDLGMTVEHVLANPLQNADGVRETLVKEGGFGMDAKKNIHNFLETL